MKSWYDQCWEEVVPNGLQKICLTCLESFGGDLKSIRFQLVSQVICLLIQKYAAASEIVVLITKALC